MERIGRYKIVRELGRGAMGVVYHAIDPNIGRPVAIKTIRLADGRKPEEQDRLRERLLREARSAGMLSHPGIVTIYDVEQQDDLAYIAMEYVDGPTLDHVLSQPKPLPAEQMFSILGQTAAALDYAHQKGIVHRDIKPANIMIAADGTAKITDFGIAKVTAADQFTMTGTIVGTPHYMSPEQVQGLAVDGRSDQFSLAVIAYEILTGEKPYTGDHLTTVVYKIVAEEPVSPHRLNRTLSGAIENVLRKGLAKKPEGRYRNCQEFTESLEKACGASRGWKTMARGGSLSEPTVAEAVKPAITLPPARHPRLDATTAERVERKSGFVPFLAGIMVVTGVLALIGWKAGPWLSPAAPAQTLAQGQTPAASQRSQPLADQPVPSPAAAQPRVTQPEITQPPVAPPQVAPDQEKPSPMPLPEARKPEPPNRPHVKTAPAKVERPPSETPEDSPRPIVRRPRVPLAIPQLVAVVSSPAGATATLEGQPDVACTTPCSLNVMPGRHTIAVTLPGYQVERREVDVGSAPMELAPVVLRAPGGTLYLKSDPPGAAIFINGKRLSQVTPAILTLSPGSYTVTVEKDGKQSTQVVVVQNKMTLLEIPLGR